MDFSAGTIKQIARSTFAAEGLNIILCVDWGIVLCHLLTEVKFGPLKFKDAMKSTDEGGYAVKLIVCTDAKNLLLAIGQPRIKAPAEKSFMTHLLWLRQKLEMGVLSQLRFIDTRDMTADGHTKGSINRSALRSLCAGILIQNHSDSMEILSYEHLKKVSCGYLRADTEGERGTNGLGVTTVACIAGDGPTRATTGGSTLPGFMFPTTQNIDTFVDNPFDILGFENITASQAFSLKHADIQRNYRKVTLSCHPDKNPDDPEAATRFLKLNDVRD